MPVDKEKAKARNEARKQSRRPKARPHPKKGYAQRADDATPRAAGRSSKSKKAASTGEQGMHPARPRKPFPTE